MKKVKLENIRLRHINYPILRLAQYMQYKLNKNEFKPCEVMNAYGKGRKWDNCSFRWLLMRLREETIELEKALIKEDAVEASFECADIANFAMMIHDNVLKLIEYKIVREDLNPKEKV